MQIFTPIQVAELITSVHPYPVDPFTICLLVASQMGEPDYMDMLQEAVGKDSMGATLPLDEYVENWPEAAAPPKPSVISTALPSSPFDAPFKHLHWWRGKRSATSNGLLRN